MEQEIKQIDRGWLEGAAKTITFIVTKDCQLACKYCYLVGKNENERMSIETAKGSPGSECAASGVFRNDINTHCRCWQTASSA